MTTKTETRTSANSTKDSDATSPNPTVAVDKNYWRDQLHPEFKYTMKKLPQFTIDSRFKTTMIQFMMKLVPSPKIHPDVTTEKLPNIGVYYYPKNDATKSPLNSAILWIHGGGRIIGSVEMDRVYCQKLCTVFNMPVLGVKYRLAPIHPFPAALDDITKAYKWLVNRLESQRTDGEGDNEPVRIAVAGESAGGGLAAELCQKLLDEIKTNQTTLPVVQLLINPMLDDRTCVDEQYDALPPHLIWNKKSNTFAWSSYLGPSYEPGDATIPQYASASRRQDLSNLPPAYIVCGTLDMFLSECRDYAERLKGHGVDVTYDEIEGGFHGMVPIAEGTDCIAKVWRSMELFGKKHLETWMMNRIESAD